MFSTLHAQHKWSKVIDVGVLIHISLCYVLPLHILIGGRGGIKMALANTQSANESNKDLILVHTLQLKPMIKA